MVLLASQTTEAAQAAGLELLSPLKVADDIVVGALASLSQ